MHHKFSCSCQGSIRKLCLLSAKLKSSMIFTCFVDFFQPCCNFFIQAILDEFVILCRSINFNINGSIIRQCTIAGGIFGNFWISTEHCLSCIPLWDCTSGIKCLSESQFTSTALDILCLKIFSGFPCSDLVIVALVSKMSSFFDLVRNLN